MCPLSPGLFALALEPLAILLRAEERVRGINVGRIEEKLSLYVDDALLYLADALSSLQTALTLFNQFGHYSGLRINWEKCVLFPLHPSVPRITARTPLKWVDEFTYLGIKIRGRTEEYIENNIQPLMSQLTAKCTAWRSLPLTPVGRANLLKIICQNTYTFSETPCHTSPRLFSEGWGGC